MKTGPGKGILRALGPGFVTGASDDDPAGVATYAQAGARFGYGLVWTALVTFPLMAAIEEIADRTALATGQGLGELAARHLSRARPLLVALLLALAGANALNIGADLTAVGSGMQLLHAGPSWLWAPIAGAAVTVLVMAGSFRVVSKVFRALTLSLVAYIVVVVLSGPDPVAVLRATFVPRVEFNGAFLALLVAVLGRRADRDLGPSWRVNESGSIGNDRTVRGSRGGRRWIRRASTSSTASGTSKD